MELVNRYRCPLHSLKLEWSVLTLHHGLSVAGMLKPSSTFVAGLRKVCGTQAVRNNLNPNNHVRVGAGGRSFASCSHLIKRWPNWFTTDFVTNACTPTSPRQAHSDKKLSSWTAVPALPHLKRSRLSPLHLTRFVRCVVPVVELRARSDSESNFRGELLYKPKTVHRAS